MARRDVDLVIRARDEARAAIQSVTQALRDFNTRQEDVQSTARGTDSVLDRLGVSFRELRGVIGETAGSQITTILDRQRAAVEQLAQELGEARGAVERHEVAEREAIATTQRLNQEREESKVAVERQIASIRALRREQDRSQRRLGRVPARISDDLTRQEQALVRLRLAQQQAAGSARVASQEERRLGQASRDAANNIETLTQRLDRAQTDLRETQTAAAGATAELTRAATATRRSLNQVQIDQGSAGNLAALGQRYRALRMEVLRLGRAAGEDLRADLMRTRTAFLQQLQISRQVRGALQGAGVGYAGLGRHARDAATDLRVLEERYRNVAGITDQAGRSVSRVAEETRRLAAEQRRASVSARRFGRSQLDLNRSGRRSLSVIQRLRGELIALTTAYIGFFGAFRGIESVVRALRTIQGAQSRLNALFEGEQSAVVLELDFIRRNAERLGIEFGVLSDTYTKFAIATQGTNLAGAETRRIFVSVAEASRVNNLSMAQLVGVLRAVEQIANKGVFQMEELRQQLGDRLPGAINILAAGLGVTTEVLSAMLETGEVGADRLSDFADELDRRFGGQLARSLLLSEAAIGRFSNAVFGLRRVIGQGEFQEGFIRLLNGLSAVFGTPQFVSAAESLSSFLAVLADIVLVLAQNWDVLVIAMTAFLAVRVIPFLAGLIGRLGGLVVAVRTARVELGGLGAALAAVFGVSGFGLAAAAIGTAIGLWVTRTKDATEALVNHQKILDQVRDSYEKAGDSAERLARESLGFTRAEALRNLNTLRERLDDSTEALGRFLRSRVQAFRRADTSVAQFYNEVLSLFRLFQRGESTITEFIANVDDLSTEAGAADSAVQSSALRIIEFARAIATAQQPAQEASDLLKLFSEDANEAAAAEERLAGATRDLAAESVQSLRQAESQNKRVNALLGRREQLQRRLFEQINRGAEARVINNTRRQIDELNNVLQDAAAHAATLFRAIDVGDSPLTAAIAARIENTIARLENIQATVDRTSQQTIAEFFDRRVQQFVELRDRFRDELQRQIDEGLSVTEIDFGPALAANRQIIAAAEQTLAEYRRIQTVSPEINAAVAALELLVRDASQNVVRFRTQLVEGEITQLETLRDALQEELADQIERVEDPAVIAGTRARLQDLDSRLQITIDGFETWFSTLENVTPELETVRAAVAALNRELRDGTVDAELEAQQQRIQDLMRLRDALRELPINVSQGLSEFESVSENLQEVNQQIIEAIDNAIQLAESLSSSSPAVAAVILELQKLRVESQRSFEGIHLSAEQLEQAFAGSLVRAVDVFSKSIAEGESVTRSLRDAFLQFAADFLRQIAQMILQQLALNAAQAVLGFLGFGGGASLGHSGLIAGQATSRRSRRVSPLAFANAIRLHEGTRNIPGLRSDEFPTILQRGEAVLTEDDPNHPANAGRGEAMPSVTFAPNIINTIDAQSFLEAALSQARGQENIINVISANRGTVRSILGV